MSENFEIAKLENSFQLPIIKFDKEFLQSFVDEKVAKYKDLVFEEKQLPEAKKDVTALNKISKEINDWAIKVDKEITAPVKQFREEVKAISSGLKEVAENITKQVATFEVEKKKMHKEKILSLIEDTKKERDFIGYIIPSEKWFSNSSTTQKEVKEEVNSQIDKAIEAEKNRLIAEQARKERIEAIENHVNLLNEKYQFKNQFSISKFLSPMYVNLENSLQDVLSCITKEFETEEKRIVQAKREQENAEEQRKQEQEKKVAHTQQEQAKPQVVVDVKPKEEVEEVAIVKVIRLTYKEKHKPLLKDLFSKLQESGVVVSMLSE